MNHRAMNFAFTLFGVTAGCGTNNAAPTTDSGASEAATQPGAEVPRDFMNVNASNNTARRFGAPQVAVSPKNPDNIVVLAQSNMGYTRACLPAAPGSDCEMIPVGPFGQQPRGAYKTPGFLTIGVFVSVDHGKTFKQIDVSQIYPPGHPEINSKGEGPLTVTADGTFYIGFNAINWGSNWDTNMPIFFPNGGVGVIKSTDQGMTWSWVSLTQTPADWPYGGSDISTGTLFVTSGLAGLSLLGPRSTGMANSPTGTIGDRWIASLENGSTWTAPQPLGGTNGSAHVNADHSSVTAARGIMATMFQGTSQSSCSFFLGDSSAPSPCIVFQTSTDGGATWSRHAVPVPAGFAPTPTTGLLLGADPTKQGHFTVVLLNQAGTEFSVYQTPDSGRTWSGPSKVTEDATKTHAAPWMAYSPSGKVGLMWRTYEPDPTNSMAAASYLPQTIWAVISGDGGKTFSQPLEVTKGTSPAPPNDPNDAFRFVGDHGPEGMTLDALGNAYVVWADWTPGERSIFFSAINVKSFKQ
jgi:BNR/Asp-box repeat